jgi:uncharacterized membrane protein YhaH (DUF805 family)
LILFEAPFSFDGRIGRLEYGLTTAAYWAFNLACLDIASADLDLALRLVVLVCILVFGWFYFAQGAKRCHDMGLSGWWQLIPFFNIFMMINKQVAVNAYNQDPDGQ